MDNSNDQPIPVVGMGATLIHWTDRTACTIVGVSDDKKTIFVQADHAKRVDKNGMSESQEYEYSPNTEGADYIFTLRKNGRYIQLGQPMRNGQRIAIGFRRQYHDYSF